LNKNAKDIICQYGKKHDANVKYFPPSIKYKTND
jgi:hypothetical protein